MPKSKIFQRGATNDPTKTRERLKTILMNKYYSLYMNNYEFEGLDYQQKDYLLKRFWCEGSIACFKMKDTEGSSLAPEGLGVFVPFVAGYWNIYDYPTKVSLVNTRGVKFIPVGLQQVDKDVVIGYALRNRKPIMMFVESYVDRMVDVLMVIKTNLKAHKMPWLIAVNPEDEAKMKELFEKLDNDDPQLYIDGDSSDKMKALVSGAPFILDKLWDIYKNLDNEVREFFGFDNLGIEEKEEHLINAEVKSNNAIIKKNEACLLDPMKEFFERILKVFSLKYGVKVKQIKMDLQDDINEEDEQEVEDKE